MPVIRVLLVDDHEVVREGIKRILAQHDDIQTIGEAVNGEDALRQAKLLNPDVVLMDIQMPGMDGITATRELRDKQPDVRVIMLSSYGDDYVTEAIEAGALGYLMKDSGAKQIVQAIYDAYRGYAPLSPSLTRQVLNEFADLRRANRSSILTDRQRVILTEVAAGLSRKQVADKLYISESTVKKELTFIFDHLGVNDQTQAVIEAMKRRLI